MTQGSYNVLMIPHWWVRAYQRASLFGGTEEFIVGDPDALVLDAWLPKLQQWRTALLEGEPLILAAEEMDLDGCSMNQKLNAALGLLDVRTCTTQESGFRSFRLFQANDEMIGHGAFEIEPTEFGIGAILGFHNPYQYLLGEKTFHTQQPKVRLVATDTASLNKLSTAEKAVFLNMLLESANHSPGHCQTKIEDLLSQPAEDSWEFLQTFSEKLRGLDTLSEVACGEKLLVGIHKNPSLIWCENEDSVVAKLKWDHRSQVLAYYVTHQIEPKIDELMEIFVQGALSLDRGYEFLNKLSDNSCPIIHGDYIFDRALLVLEWTTRALCKERFARAPLPELIRTFGFDRIWQGDFSELDQLYKLAFAQGRFSPDMLASEEQISLCYTEPSLYEISETNEENEEDEGLEVVIEEPQRSVQGAVAANMRQVALEELDRLKRLAPKTYSQLRRAYFDSLDGEQKTILFDLQDRMQKDQFESQLHRKMVRFMVENPSAWGYRE